MHFSVRLQNTTAPAAVVWERASFLHNYHLSCLVGAVCRFSQPIIHIRISRLVEGVKFDHTRSPRSLNHASENKCCMRKRDTFISHELDASPRGFLSVHWRKFVANLSISWGSKIRSHAVSTILGSCLGKPMLYARERYIHISWARSFPTMVSVSYLTQVRSFLRVRRIMRSSEYLLPHIREHFCTGKTFSIKNSKSKLQYPSNVLFLFIFLRWSDDMYETRRWR